MYLITLYTHTRNLLNPFNQIKKHPYTCNQIDFLLYRYIDKELWGTMLNMLLNIESCKKLPNLDEIIRKLNKYLSIQQKVVLKHNFTSLKNALKKN